MSKTNYYNPADEIGDGDTAPNARDKVNGILTKSQAEFETRERVFTGCYTSPTLTIDNVNGKVDCAGLDAILKGKRLATDGFWSFAGSTPPGVGTYTLQLDDTCAYLATLTPNSAHLTLGTVRWNGTDTLASLTPAIPLLVVGPGDMLKSVYDTNNDGMVDHAALADAAPWSGVTDKPSTFTPATHASTHHTGNADALAPGDIGAEAAANKSTDTTLGGGSPSDTLYPSQKAVATVISGLPAYEFGDPSGNGYALDFVSDPPSSPADGDAYLIAPPGTGAWTDWTGWAFYSASYPGWENTPADGSYQFVYVLRKNAIYQYAGAGTWHKKVQFPTDFTVLQPQTRCVGCIDADGPPATPPAGGTRYLLLACTWGADRGNQIATYTGSAYTYETPEAGWILWAGADTGGCTSGGAGLWYFDGATWTLLVTASDAGMTNPMTAAGDLIIGGTAGAATRLAKGDDGKVLTLTSGAPAWESPTGGSGLTDPMTTDGDMIVRASGVPARLAKGSDGQLLGMVSGAEAWVNAPTGGGTEIVTVATKTADYTLTTDDQTVLMNSAGITATLPDASTCAGQVFTVKNLHTGDATVNTLYPKETSEASIPALTGPTSFGVASSSGFLATGLEAWHAFAQTSAFYASESGAYPKWLQFQFPYPVIPSSYTVEANNQGDQEPINWTFEGSVDGTTWDTLDTVVVSPPFPVNTLQTRTVTTTTAYTYFRWVWNADNGSGVVVVGHGMNIYGTADSGGTSQQIDNANSFTLAQYVSARLISDGTNYWKI